MVTGLLGFTSIEAYIDQQKLSFLGALWRLKSSDIASQVFLNRLYQFRNKCAHANRGFVPDVVEILHKNNLHDYLETYISTNTFPKKEQWKRTCKQTIISYEQTKWRRRISSCDDYFRFREVNQTLTPSVIWKAALVHPKALESLSFLAKLSCKPRQTEPTSCQNCDERYIDELYHKLFDCKSEMLKNILTKYWTNIENQFSVNFSTFLKNCDNSSQVYFMLGKQDDTITVFLTKYHHTEFMNLTAAFFKSVYSVWVN